MKDFQGQVVLITGAGKGSGRSLAMAFASRGAMVAANDISPLNVEALVAQILAADGQARAYVDDIAKKVAAQALVNQVEEDFGRIDILINHAAVEPRFALLDMDEWDWHRTLNVNLTGAFLMLQSAGRVMREQGSGVIVNLITEAGSSEEEMRGAFLSSMAGLQALSEQAGQELAPYGIQVHTVSTGSPDHVDLVLNLCRRKR